MFILGGYVALMALAQRPDVFKVNTFIAIISLSKLFVIKCALKTTKFSTQIVLMQTVLIGLEKQWNSLDN